MYKAFKILILGLVFPLLNSCKNEPPLEKRPFNIFTNLPGGFNQIYQCFALNDNTFAVSVQDRANSKTTFYKYSANLQLIDTTVVSGHTYSQPIFLDDNSIVFVCDFYNKINNITALKFNKDLKLIDTRIITNMVVQSSSDAIYNTFSTRLSDGTIVLANSYENNLKDKIVIVAFDDLFTDNQPKWIINPPSYNTEWINSLYKDESGNFYVIATDHINATHNMLIKYNGKGKMLHRKDDIAHSHENDFLLVDNNNLVYYNYYGFQKLDTQLNAIMDKPMPYSIKSPLIKCDNHYFYAQSYNNTDGLFMKMIKMNTNFENQQEKIYGSRGTNVKTHLKRFLLRLTSNKLVAIEMIENREITGNHWLLQSFNTNLESD